MFCTNCGKKLDDGSSFCSYCGTKIEHISAEDEKKTIKRNISTEFEQDISSKDSNISGFSENSETIQQIIGKNIAYYMEQFEKIRQTGKSKLNWASFFLGFIHSAYRNVWKDWLKAVKLPLIIELVGMLLTTISLALISWLVIISIPVMIVGNIWLIITQILFAKRFNKIYMNHVEQNLARGETNSDVSIKRSIVVYLVAVTLSILVGGFMSIIMIIGISFKVSDSSSLNYEIDNYSYEDSFDYETDNYKYENNFDYGTDNYNYENNLNSEINNYEDMIESSFSISVSDIFVSNFDDRISWHSDTTGYYMIPHMEEETPVVFFTAENNTFNYSIVYYAEITSIEPTASGGLVCSGPIFFNTKAPSEANGTVEITWNSWESVDFPSIQMINGHQFTDVSMIADDYSYWGPVESE